MSAFQLADRHCEAVPDWHGDFLATILPAVESVAQSRFRRLPAHEREEATAEAVASAMVFYVRLVRRGKSPTAFAGRLAVVSVLRVLAGRLASASDNCNDVLSRYARLRRGIKVESLDSRQQSAKGQWQEIAVEDRKSTPADIAACRIDFGEWLSRMTARRRQIAEALASGYRTDEVAEQFCLSHGRISQLRREFEKSWHEFHGTT